MTENFSLTGGTKAQTAVIVVNEVIQTFWFLLLKILASGCAAKKKKTQQSCTLPNWNFKKSYILVRSSSLKLQITKTAMFVER